MSEQREKAGPIRQGVMWLRKLMLPSSGLLIGENQLHAKKDPNGNQDPYWKRQDGTEMNLTGEVLFCRATSNLTLTTSAQSIVGGGDSSKVRLLLPTIGEWYVNAICEFAITVVDPDSCMGELFVNDSGSAETGRIYFGYGQVDVGTPSQQWKVTTTAANTPVELKARKETDAGTALAVASSTTLAAMIGAGGGSTVESVDHGTLTGRGDDDHAQYGQLADAETATGIWTFANGLKTDTISEETGAAGVTIDSVLLKDGEVDGVVVDAHAARHTDGSDDIRNATDALRGIAMFDAFDFDVTAGDVHLEDSVVKAAGADSGAATAASHYFTIAGGTGITTAGADATVTITGHAETHDYDTHDGGVPYDELEYDDATSDPLIDGAAADDGDEDSAARKDHVHPKHHAQAHQADHTDGTDDIQTATTAQKGIVSELATIAEANTGTDTGRACTPDSLGSPTRTIVLTAAGGAPSTTTPCSDPTKVEAGTNDVDYWVLDFDDAADEYAFWGPIPMPENYDGGTMTAKFYWTTTATDTDGVAWAIQLLSLDDNDAIDTAWGAAVVTTDDAQSAAGEMLITAASGAITPGGTAVAPEMLCVRVYRDVSDANDDMTEDARLIAVKLEYTCEGYSD